MYFHNKFGKFTFFIEFKRSILFVLLYHFLYLLPFITTTLLDKANFHS